MENSFEVLGTVEERRVLRSDVESDVTEESVAFSPSNGNTKQTSEDCRRLLMDENMMERLVTLTADEVLHRHDQALSECRRLRITCQKLRRELETLRNELSERDATLAKIRVCSAEMTKELETETPKSGGGWFELLGSPEKANILWGVLTAAQTILTFGIMLCAIRGV